MHNEVNQLTNKSTGMALESKPLSKPNCDLQERILRLGFPSDPSSLLVQTNVEQVLFYYLILFLFEICIKLKHGRVFISYIS